MTFMEGTRSEPSLEMLIDTRGASAVHDALVRASGVSMTVCDEKGTLLRSAFAGTDPLHRALIGEPRALARYAAVAHGHEVVRVNLAGGAVALVVGLSVEGERAGAVVAGPVWRAEPTLEELDELLGALGHSMRATAETAASALVGGANSRHHNDTLLSLADAMCTLSEEQVQQQRTLGALSTLNRIGQSVTSQMSLQEVLEGVLEGALPLLAADEGSIMLLDESRENMHIVAARGLPDEVIAETSVRVGDGISGQVAQEGRARVLRRGMRVAASRVDELRASMCVPMVAHDTVIGVLNLKGRRDRGDFGPDDVGVAQVMASQAAAAIASTQLYESARKRATELGALFAIGTAVNSELERNQVLQRVLDHAIDLLGARQGSIMLLNEDTEELSIEVACGLPAEVVSSVRLRLGEGIAGKVAQSGQARRLRKGETVSTTRSSREKHAALCVPLTVRDRVTGVLNVSDRKDGRDFTEEQTRLLIMMANQAAIAIENAKLHDELHELFVSSITALANAIDARDPYTRGHSERVAVYAVRIGERLGLSGRDLDFLRYAALLHDVGKINIRDEILNKPGRLTDDEFQVMKRHPEYGAAIMMPVKAFQKIIPFMFYHHEKYCAGGGYPMGLTGDAIPLEARIISVADSYDAMTSHRPYRRALSIEQAVQELIKNSGGQFDPRVVEIFLLILEEDPVFARSGIEASISAEREGWIRASVGGAFSPRGGAPVSPRPRVPSTG